MYFELNQFCPQGSRQYRVQFGDTIYEIANRFNTTVQEIRAINPQINPYRLYVGQVICIPTTSTRCSGRYYRVRPGDSINEIANRFNVSVNEIIRANPGIDPNRLRIGETICIPFSRPDRPARCPQGSRAYRIEVGDTFENLADRLNTTVNELIRLNPDVNPRRLYVGQIICLPVTGRPEPPEQCPRGSRSYRIQIGDNFNNLAARFDTTVNELIRLNPYVNPRRLYVGQTICVPVGRPDRPQCPQGTRPYRVEQGDTFENLADRFNTTINELRRLNPDVTRLYVGLTICVPIRR